MFRGSRCTISYLFWFNQKSCLCAKVHARLYDESEFACYDPSQEPIFPSELQVKYQSFYCTDL